MGKEASSQCHIQAKAACFFVVLKEDTSRGTIGCKRIGRHMNEFGYIDGIFR